MFDERNFKERVRFCWDRVRQLPQREHDFVKDMRRLLLAREDAADLGMTPWEPSVHQINYLNRIYEML